MYQKLFLLWNVNIAVCGDDAEIILGLQMHIYCKFYGDFICKVDSTCSFSILFQEYPPFLGGALIAKVLDLDRCPSTLKSQVP